MERARRTEPAFRAARTRESEQQVHGWWFVIITARVVVSMFPLPSQLSCVSCQTDNTMLVVAFHRITEFGGASFRRCKISRCSFFFSHSC